MSDAVRTDDGCQLWAEQHGHGSPLVLCHGGPGLWDMFDDLAATLADIACVVRWDQRGCGRSERRGPFTVARYLDDLDAVRGQLAGGRMALLGHSWGATLALRYALLRPDRVSHLIYVSGTGIDPHSTWRPAFQQSFRQRLGADLPRWEQLHNRARTPAEDEEFAILQWSADFADEGTAVAHAENLATPWFEINWECNAALGVENSQYLTGTDVAAQCRALSIPTLIFDGACDVRPRWAVDSLHRALPHARRTILAGAGHLPWVEDPDGFRDAITGFLAQPAPAGGTGIHHELPDPATPGRADRPPGSR
jgi:proline iminopeptidase